MWSTERKRFTDSQWNALTLMTKEGPVQYKDEYGVRVGKVQSEFKYGVRIGKVPHTFILWYPKGSSPTGYKEVELSREGLQSDFWMSKLHALFNVWKRNKDLTKINI